VADAEIHLVEVPEAVDGEAGAGQAVRARAIRRHQHPAKQ